VQALNSSFYAQWRIQCGVAPILREDDDCPPERLLQAVWLHQRLRREQLKTGDGRPIRILHPGFHNVEGGPDFRGAMVQMGEDPPRSGDVEVDLRASGWRAHGHHCNPAFKNVILHVLWDSEQAIAGAPPVLVIRQALDAPLGELSLWLGSEGVGSWPEDLRGRCCEPLRQLSETQLRGLLRQAAQVRLQAKAAQLQARARQAGWEQALWEGLFRALGYKHNVWPMQCLAELRPRWLEHGVEALLLQARLLGIGGLLPLELTRTQSGADGYLRRIWDQWWRERDAFSDCVLPRGLWRFHGLRPANHPQRRLALASRWCQQGDLPAKLEKWCAQELPEKAIVRSLLETLQVGIDEFWSWHCTFRSTRFRKPQPLLGGTRVSDLAVNVILPWLWVRAVEGNNPRVQQRLERRYFAWPAGEDNSILRLARQRLLGGAPARVFGGAAAQQGLIQIVRDFCEHSNAVCDQCQFPQLVKDWYARAQPSTTQLSGETRSRNSEERPAERPTASPQSARKDC
jgi:uncharacterized protein DUF2851